MKWQGRPESSNVEDRRGMRMGLPLGSGIGGTHGSSEERVGWLRRGLDSGRVEVCDTFGTD